MFVVQIWSSKIQIQILKQIRFNYIKFNFVKLKIKMINIDFHIIRATVIS